MHIDIDCEVERVLFIPAEGEPAVPAAPEDRGAEAPEAGEDGGAHLPGPGPQAQSFHHTHTHTHTAYILILIQEQKANVVIKSQHRV